MTQMTPRGLRRKYAPETPRQITEKLKRSMLNSETRTDPEAARKFLSQLSMYNDDGQLKEKYE